MKAGFFMPVPICGKVTQPDDLGPAIAALGDVGKRYLTGLLVEAGNSTPEPWMLAHAADFERGELKTDHK